MSVIIRLQGLPWSASAMNIRHFFSGLSIPAGGVHIIGGDGGDAFIAFSSDDDARMAMKKNMCCLNDMPIQLFLSSKAEMQSVIDSARSGVPTAATSSAPQATVASSTGASTVMDDGLQADMQQQQQQRPQFSQNMPMGGMMMQNKGNMPSGNDFNTQMQQNPWQGFHGMPGGATGPGDGGDAGQKAGQPGDGAFQGQYTNPMMAQQQRMRQAMGGYSDTGDYQFSDGGANKNDPSAGGRGYNHQGMNAAGAMGGMSDPLGSGMNQGGPMGGNMNMQGQGPRGGGPMNQGPNAMGGPMSQGQMNQQGPMGNMNQMAGQKAQQGPMGDHMNQQQMFNQHQMGGPRMGGPHSAMGMNQGDGQGSFQGNMTSRPNTSQSAEGGSSQGGFNSMAGRQGFGNNMMAGMNRFDMPGSRGSYTETPGADRPVPGSDQFKKQFPGDPARMQELNKDKADAPWMSNLNEGSRDFQMGGRFPGDMQMNRMNEGMQGPNVPADKDMSGRSTQDEQPFSRQGGMYGANRRPGMPASQFPSDKMEEDLPSTSYPPDEPSMDTEPESRMQSRYPPMHGYNPESRLAGGHRFPPGMATEDKMDTDRNRFPDYGRQFPMEGPPERRFPDEVGRFTSDEDKRPGGPWGPESGRFPPGRPGALGDRFPGRQPGDNPFPPEDVRFREREEELMRKEAFERGGPGYGDDRWDRRMGPGEGRGRFPPDRFPGERGEMRPAADRSAAGAYGSETPREPGRRGPSRWDTPKEEAAPAKATADTKPPVKTPDGEATLDKDQRATSVEGSARAEAKPGSTAKPGDALEAAIRANVPGYEPRAGSQTKTGPGLEGRGSIERKGEPTLPGKRSELEEKRTGFEGRGGPMFDDRRPGFEGRGLGLESRGPAFEGRGPSAEGREPGFEGRRPGFEGRGPGFEGKGPGFEGRGPGFEGRGPGFEGREPGFEGRGPGFEGRRPGFEGRGMGLEGREPGFEERRPGFEDRGPGFEGKGPGFEERRPGFEDRGPGFEGKGPGFEGRRPGFEPRGPGYEGREPGFEGRGPRFDGRGPGFEGREPGFEGRGPGFEGREPGFEGRGPGFEGRGPGHEGRGPGFEGRRPGFEDRESGFQGRGPEFDRGRGEMGFDGRRPPFDRFEDPEFEERERRGLEGRGRPGFDRRAAMEFEERHGRHRFEEGEMGRGGPPFEGRRGPGFEDMRDLDRGMEEPGYNGRAPELDRMRGPGYGRGGPGPRGRGDGMRGRGGPGMDKGSRGGHSMSEESFEYGQGRGAPFGEEEMEDFDSRIPGRGGPMFDRPFRGRGDPFFRGRGGPPGPFGRGRGMAMDRFDDAGPLDVDARNMGGRPDGPPMPVRGHGLLGEAPPDAPKPSDDDAAAKKEDGDERRRDADSRQDTDARSSQRSYERERERDRDRRYDDRRGRDRDDRRYDDRSRYRFSRDRSRRTRSRSSERSRDRERHSTTGRSGSPRGRAEGRDRSLCLKNIPTSVNYKEVRRFLQPIDVPYDGLKIINDEKGQRIGVAYVQLRRLDDVQRALRRDGEKMGSSTVSVTTCTDEEFTKAVDSYVPPRKDTSKDTPSTSVADIKLPQGQPPKDKPTVSSTGKTRYIIQLKNLPQSITRQDIIEFLKGATVDNNGESAFIEFDESGVATGMGFVELKSDVDYKRALTFDGSKIGTTAVRVFSGKADEADVLKGKQIEMLQRAALRNVTRGRLMGQPPRPGFAGVRPGQPQQAGSAPAPPATPQQGSAPVRPPGPPQPGGSPVKSPAQQQGQAAPAKTPSPEGDQKTTLDTVCVHIQGLPLLATPQDIRLFFGESQTALRGINIAHDSRGKPLGEGFVEFRTRADFDKALKKDKTSLGRHIVAVKPISKKEMLGRLGTSNQEGQTTPGKAEEAKKDPGPGPGLLPMPTSSSQSTNAQPQGPPPGLVAGPQSNGQQQAQQQRPKPLLAGMGPGKPMGMAPPPIAGSAGGNKIIPPGVLNQNWFYVRCQNFPSDISIAEILHFFSGFRPLGDSIRLHYSSDGKPTGNAVVGFGSREEAQRALSSLNQKPCRQNLIGLFPA